MFSDRYRDTETKFSLVWYMCLQAALYKQAFNTGLIHKIINWTILKSF